MEELVIITQIMVGGEASWWRGSSLKDLVEEVA
jgi:hypothetical protein